MKKEKTSGQENSLLKRIDSIDYEEEAFKIIDGPDKYFEPFFKNIKSSSGKIYAYLSILSILRKIDTSEDLAKKTAEHFLEKYPMTTWIDKLIFFYGYGISIMNYIIDNHGDVILDMYNEKRMNRKTMEKGMKSFADIKQILIRDKEALGKCIVDMEEEKKRAEDFEDFENHFM